MTLNDAQLAQLLRAINPKRVGSDGKGFSHLQAYDVRAHLIRLFGFGGFSECVDVMEPVFETCEEREKNGKKWTAWTVSYRARCTLTIPALDCTYTEWAEGSASNHPSRSDAHDMAIKTAESQAFKRCAANLGDQFGLSLYAGGSLSGVVGRSLAYPEPDDSEQREPVDAHVTAVPPEDAPAEDPREHSAPPTPQPEPGVADDGTARAQTVADEAIHAAGSGDKRTLASLTIRNRDLWRTNVLGADGKPLRLKALLDQLARTGADDAVA